MPMKQALMILLLGGWVLLSGCIWHKAAPVRSAPASAAATPAIVTPDNSLTARVYSYNSTGRFAILSFPFGKMPAMGQSLFLYRSGLKVAEVKIVGPQRDNNIVADLITGEAQAGDEVRDQ